MDGMIVSALIILLGVILGLIVVCMTPPGDRDPDRRRPNP